MLSARQAEPRYTADDLAAAAHRAGYAASKRLIADWVAIGLLDKGVPRGKGRGRGKEYRWSDHQRQLFLTLLQKQGTVRRPVLCNIPVALWLIWGDQLVPLRQARRALATWAGQYATVSWSAAQRTARDLLDQLDHPSATQADRERLRDLVAQAAYTGQVNEDDLAANLRQVVDPNGTGLTRGPLGIVDAPQYVRTIMARVRAVRQLADVPDALLRRAREDYRLIGPVTNLDAAAINVGDVAVNLPALGARAPGFEEIVNRSCLDLLTLLGLNLNDRARSDAPEGSAISPQT